ncbi:hypothetical protein BaRGS_00011564 [Batillaria attramentaria]|uniref:Centrosomal protein of 162 kDa n=1 Tax=Batillaria attramentaria TaxID=370345 RepID=A0ABD0LCZ3_9CAEN
MSRRRLSKEDFDATFEAFLKTSVSSEEDTDKINDLLKNPKKAKPKDPGLWWMQDDDKKKSSESTKSFLKSKKTVPSDSSHKGKSENGSLSRSPKGKMAKHAIVKKGKTGVNKTKGGRDGSPGKNKSSRARGPSDVSMSKDSLEDNGGPSGVESDRSPGKPGFDTLDELAEKQKFFQDLESKANESLDYSQLNRDLSQTGTMFSAGMAVKGMGDDAQSGSPGTDHGYQPDPEVSLLDSMDSTLNTTTSPQAPGKEGTSRDTTQDNLGQTLPETQGTAGPMGTNTSKEIEELHRALQEVGLSRTLPGLESHNASGKEQAGADTATDSRRPVDRSVGDILKEMDEIQKRQQAVSAAEDDVKLMSDYKSPRSPRSPGLHRQVNVEDQGGFDNSHTEDTEVYQPVTAVLVSEKSAKRRPSSSSTPNTKNTEDNKGRKSLKDRYSHVQSSGYGKRSPEVSPQKSRSPSWSPIRPSGRTRQTHSSLDSASRSRKGSLSPSPRRPKQDMRQVSKTQVVQGRSLAQPAMSQEEPIVSRMKRRDHGETTAIHEDVLIAELKDLREQLQEERRKNTKLLADQAARDRESTRQAESLRLDYEEQIFKLKQENFVLAAKRPSTEEQVARLEKSVRSKKNCWRVSRGKIKRLYEEIRSKEKAAKATEEAMFKENQRLNAELTSVRSLLEQKETELRSKGIITSLAAQQQIAAGNQDSVTEATRAVHLETELRECKRQHENTQRELKILQQSRSELEQHVDALVMEREMLKKQLNAAKQARPEEIKELEQRHNEEVDRLKRKLKWYAENQELLDKSTRTIKARDEEIQRFKLRLEELQTETGKRLEENKLRSKEKAADVKKIADLERQIKEMEQIIRRRHPNSLPALMMAAATAPEAAPTVENSRGRTVEVLENRIKKLEKELEKKDEEASTLLRAMEQKYNAVKFEERVADLEGQLRLYKRQGDGDMKQYEHPHTHALALERELENTRERYKRQVTDLAAEVERLTGQLTKLKKQQDNGLRSEQARWHQVESELRSQVAALQSTVQEREKELHTAMAMVERLQKTPNGPRLPDKKHGKGAAGDENYLTTGLNAFPDPSQTSKKRYQPEAFADQHIADVVRENEDLRNKIELLQLERDQQRVDLRRSLAETEAVARRSREDYENQIEAMRTAHEKELNRLRAEQALFNSTSKVAALQSRCDSQEVMVQHLQRQLAQREAEVEQMAGLKKREAELKDQVETLQEKLREAKRTQAPEMRHYEALEEKIATLTERHKKREQELESLLRSSQRMASQDLIEEAARWKKMVETKNLEICKFREELDSILGVLRELQRQGIKLPYVMTS